MLALHCGKYTQIYIYDDANVHVVCGCRACKTLCVCGKSILLLIRSNNSSSRSSGINDQVKMLLNRMNSI